MWIAITSILIVVLFVVELILSRIQLKATKKHYSEKLKRFVERVKSLENDINGYSTCDDGLVEDVASLERNADKNDEYFRMVFDYFNLEVVTKKSQEEKKYLRKKK